VDRNFWFRTLDGLGYSEGRNYIIEARFADTDLNRLPALAKELIDRGVDVIVTIGTPTVGAAKKATATIPISWPGATIRLGTVWSPASRIPGGT
jgi:putative ABC transport system substrate-binding protein